MRAVEGDNAALDPCDRVTIDSVRNHNRRHFAVQDVARATYREILERRAQENRVDFVNGVASAITPMALYETIMAKGYEVLVDPDTTVDVGTAIVAVGRLQALLATRDVQPDLARLKAQVAQIGEAVGATVPPSMWADILAKLDDLEPSPRDVAHDGDEVDEACEPDDVDEF